MSKYYGSVGYATLSETSPSVWVEEVTERSYYGDVTRNRRRLESGTGLNDNINISNEISIVGDPFAYENFHAMRYATFMGTKWKITDVEVQYPRLILTLGGIYNVEDETTST